VVHRPSGFGVVPSRCTDRLPTSRTKNTEIRWRVTAQSTRKKSHANIVDAWVRRNCCQVVSVSRTGAVGIPKPLQDAADGGRSHAVAECEQLTLDSLLSPAPVIPGHALDQHGHRVLRGVDGRGGGDGSISWRPGQRRIVPGVTRRWLAQHGWQPSDERGEDPLDPPSPDGAWG
jgi:hypothetical protein